MTHLKAKIFGFLLVLAFITPLPAQENKHNKPPSEQKHSHLKAPTAGLNLSAIKLKESLGYKIDPNTHIGIGSGFKFGLKINF